MGSSVEGSYNDIVSEDSCTEIVSRGFLHRQQRIPTMRSSVDGSHTKIVSRGFRHCDRQQRSLAMISSVKDFYHEIANQGFLH